MARSRIYHSIMFLTINFNKKITKNEMGYKNYINKLKQFADNIFNEENTDNFLMDDSNMRNIQIYKSLENSKIMKHPHLHILIIISNYNKKAKLNYQYIRDEGKKWNDDKAIHFKSKVIYNTKDIPHIIDYMKKGSSKNIYQYLQNK